MELSTAAHIGYIHLRVADLDRALMFYEKGLGFRVREKDRETACLSATGDIPDHVRLTEHPGARPKPRHTTGLFHAAIRFPHRAALAAAVRLLKRQEYRILGASDHGVSEAIYLADPDQNEVEIYTDRPRSQWPRAGGQIAMVTEELDLESLLDLADSGGTVGIDQKTDIGHVHLQVGDLGRAEEFFSGTLGFKVTQRSYPGALFFAAGDYHHHIGANVWAGRNLPPSPEDAAGLIAFSVVVPGAGDPASNQLKDPDGNRIEVIRTSRQ